MRLKNIPGAREAIAGSDLVVHEPMQAKGGWRQVFGNGHPIHVEIGMGKGKFICEMARRFPEINYVGIEKYSSVLLRALQKMACDPLPNLKFVRMDAEEITEVFGRGEVDRIYLNFLIRGPRTGMQSAGFPPDSFWPGMSSSSGRREIWSSRQTTGDCLNLRWRSFPTRTGRYGR